MRSILLSYVPVLHEGYRELFIRNPLINELYLFGEDLIQKFDPLRKDIRALSPHLIRQAVESWRIFKAVYIANESILGLLNRDRVRVIMPDEDISHEVAEKYLPDCQAQFVGIFLRWDSKRVLAQVEVPCDEIIQADEFAAKAMNMALSEVRKSHDWWRQVGAVVAKRNEVIFVAFNRHVPSPNHVLAFGDPRANFKKGVHFELSPALHPELAAVSWAASRADISLSGADIYVTTFPCPPCARAIAYSGIRKLFFLEGYSVYDGVDILRSRGVKIVRLKI